MYLPGVPQLAGSPPSLKLVVMMFVVAVRPNMLPGLKLSRLHEATREALEDIWGHKESRHCCTNRENKLADVLMDLEKMRQGSEPDIRSKLYDLSD
jgi:hypothetical protein